MRPATFLPNTPGLPKTRFILLAWMCLALTTGVSARNADGTLGLIRYPMSTHPALVVSGGEIELLLSSETAVSDIRVELVDKDNRIEVYRSSSGRSFKPEDRRAFGYPLEYTRIPHWRMNWWWRPRITVRDLVRVPIKLSADLPEEFYGLHVTSSAGGDTSDRAVRVYREWPSKYEICHITDIHIGADFVPDIHRVFLKVAQKINNEQPAFVLITGDNIDSAMPSEMHLFLAVVDRFQVPTFVIPGNHDSYGKVLDGKIDALKYLGENCYSFDFGTHHYLGMDGATRRFDKEQMRWIEKDLESVPGNSFKCIFNHGVAFQDQWKHDWLSGMLNKHEIDLYLHGHTHKDVIEFVTEAKTLSVQTGPAFGRGGYYNTINIEDDRVMSIRSAVGQEFIVPQ